MGLIIGIILLGTIYLIIGFAIYGAYQHKMEGITDFDDLVLDGVDMIVCVVTMAFWPIIVVLGGFFSLAKFVWNHLVPEEDTDASS